MNCGQSRDKSGRSAVFFSLFILTLLIPYMAGATADGPDHYRVIDVQPGNNLNIRSGPSVAHERIGRIPAGTDGLVNLGCEGGLSISQWQAASLEEREGSRDNLWCKVEYAGITGWVAGRHLGESAIPAAAGHTLHGTAWQLEIEGVEEAGDVWIAFSETGEVSGNTGCNLIKASYEYNDTKLSISPIASTMMACLDEERSARAAMFLRAIEGATRFTLDDGSLILRDDANSPLLTLEPRMAN